MKLKSNTPLVNEPETVSLKQAYKTPVLQRFGFVADLTNSAVGSCNNDGIASCKGTDPNMARMA